MGVHTSSLDTRLTQSRDYKGRAFLLRCSEDWKEFRDPVMRPERFLDHVHRRPPPGQYRCKHKEICCCFDTMLDTISAVVGVLKHDRSASHRESEGTQMLAAQLGHLWTDQY